MSNTFRRLAAAGYARTTPIIPPDADVSEKSSLYSRLGTHQDARGKTPGTKNRDGKWSSFDWVRYEADERDYDRWAAMGAGVGLKTGQGLIPIDADTTDPEIAERVRKVVEEFVGEAPVRVGNAPKALYVVRTDGDVPYQRVEFGKPDKRGNMERVELLSDGRQFVADGVHPKTGKPYVWTRQLVPFEQLPLLPANRVHEFMERLRQVLPAAQPLIKEGGTAAVAQETLRGDPALVRKAVEATPNTSEHFPSRERYRDMGYAIKAAMPDEREAFDLFNDWCHRWADGHNEQGVIEADWARIKPPFRRGANWLYAEAARISPDAFNVAEAFFEELPDEVESPFAQQEAAQAQQPVVVKIEATPYGFPDPARIPRREWLYGTHLIRKFVSATVAPSGVGKSSLTIVEALAMASGKALLGVLPKAPVRVWLWNGEDPLEELERRVAASMKHYGLTADDIGDRLFLDTGREMEIVLAEDTRDGCRITVPVASALVDTLRANRIDAMIVDPFVSSHRVSENDNGAIDMVSKQWAKIADATNCAIDLVHHVRKLNGGEVTVEDSRGAVSLIATSRSARALTKMSKGEAVKLGLEANGAWRRLFRFGDSKNNLAAPVDLETLWFQIASVPLGNGEGDALDAVLTGDSVGVVTVFEGAVEAAASLSDSTERDAIIAAVSAGGGQWRADLRSPYWVGNAVADALKMDLSDDAGKGRVKAVVAKLVKDGVLKTATRLDAKGMPRQYVEVGVIHTDNTSEGDVFG